MVEDLDVVARLSDHQANLEPPPARPRVALLALPSPPLLGLLLPERFARSRQRAIEALAAELGGGDGPAPVLDLDRDARPLDQALDDLSREGVETLTVIGARDQPGFARAVSARWPGALRAGPRPSQVSPLLRGQLAPLMDDPAPVVGLGQGVVRVRPGAPIPTEAEVVLAALDDEGDPLAFADSPRVRPYALDPGRVVAPWSGFLPPAGLHGTSRGQELRDRWGRYWRGLGEPAAVRRAALGLDPLLERRLAADRGRTNLPLPLRSPARAKIFAITGLDGSGKTTHASNLVRQIEDEVGRCVPIKIYRQGPFLELANELSGRTRRGAPLAAFRVSRLVKLIDSLRVYRDLLRPALAECAAVVMDRYVETHVAAAESQLGWDLRRHPLLRIFPPADLVFWLAISAEDALDRLGLRGERPSADEHLIGLRGYQRVFERLAEETAGSVPLEATAPLADNAAEISRRALGEVMSGAEAQGFQPQRGDVPKPRVGPASAARPWGGGTFGGTSPGGDPEGVVSHSPKVPGSANEPSLGASAPGPRCQVILGWGEDLPVLGQEVFSLRRMLIEALGGQAEGVAEALWLEAYAAQLVLDLRTRDIERAYLPLWPEALYHMPGWGDLTALLELGRLLAPLIEVRGFRSDPVPFLGELARGPAAARRLEAAYGRAVNEIAEEAGWAREARSPAPTAPAS